MTKSLIYQGIRTESGCGVCTEHGPLPACTEICNHSPTGFEWGYDGSGPAQLALAILADAIGPRVALRIYQEFKRVCISRLDTNAWELRRQDVLNIAASILEEMNRSVINIH